MWIHNTALKIYFNNQSIADPHSIPPFVCPYPALNQRSEERLDWFKMNADPKHFFSKDALNFFKKVL
jgi:hypothetical protein